MCKISDEPIHPTPYVNSDGTIDHSVHKGLTKREHIAIEAMQGILAGNDDTTVSHIRKVIGLPSDEPWVYEEHFPKYVSVLAVRFADALLNELNKPVVEV